MMELVTKNTVVIIDAMAFIIFAIATVEAFFTDCGQYFPRRRQIVGCPRSGYVTDAGSSPASLPLAADIIRTSIAPTWQEVGSWGPSL
jgi:hypothetical protein